MRARVRERARERRDKDVYTKIHLAILGDSLQDDVSLIDEAFVSILQCHSVLHHLMCSLMCQGLPNVFLISCPHSAMPSRFASPAHVCDMYRYVQR